MGYMCYMHFKLRCLAILLKEIGEKPASRCGSYEIKLDNAEVVIVTKPGSNTKITDYKVFKKILDSYSDFSICLYRRAESVKPMMELDNTMILSEHRLEGVFVCTVHADTSGIVVIDTYNRVMVGENDEVVAALVAAIRAL